MAAEAERRAGAILEIDLDGIVANWRSLAARVAPVGCAAVVKADGYGLGAAPVARALAGAGCRLFFVATLDEGIALREALGDGREIAVFNGMLPGCAGDFAAAGLLPVLNDPGQTEEWRKAGGGPAMLHLDTGMARLGLTQGEFEALIDASAAAGWRALLSHLACAETPEHPLNDLQLQRFAAARARLPAVPASLAASAGIFLGPAYHFDFVRPGAALYGINPHPGSPNPMRQVVHLRARILQVREIDRGQTVGYGASHTMETPGRLATVALGYADGWFRSLTGRGSARLGGRRIPLIGRVSMDLAIFDVTAVAPALARPGAFVDLLDADYGVDSLAADAGTIGYEVLTALGRRYHRVYRGAAG